KGFDPPNEASEPGFLRRQRRIPDGEYLRTLVDALETFLGFGNRLNRSDPQFLSARRVNRDADALPAVFHAKQRSGQDAAEAQILPSLWRFKKAVRLGRSQEIDYGFDTN